MALYLQLNGTSDYLRAPSMTIDEVRMEFKARYNPTTEYYIDIRTGVANSYLYRNTSGVEFTSGSSLFVNGMYWNDVKFTNSQNAIPYDTKGTLKLVMSTSGTDDPSFFANNAGTASTLMAADVFSIKLLLGGVVQAHYDMSTGTIQDQSGNGRHATLTGGTWLDDGTGGGTTDITITSVIATSTLDAIAPTLSTVSSISTSIDVLTGTVTAEAPSPSVEGIRNISVVTVVADGIADSFAPSVVSGPLSVQVMAVISSLVSTALAPTIVIKREIISKLNLSGKGDSPLLLQGRSQSISLNGTTSQSIHWKGGIQ